MGEILTSKQIRAEIGRATHELKIIRGINGLDPIEEVLARIPRPNDAMIIRGAIEKAKIEGRLEAYRHTVGEAEEPVVTEPYVAYLTKGEITNV